MHHHIYFLLFITGIYYTFIASNLAIVYHRSNISILHQVEIETTMIISVKMSITRFCCLAAISMMMIPSASSSLSLFVLAFQQTTSFITHNKPFKYQKAIFVERMQNSNTVYLTDQNNVKETAGVSYGIDAASSLLQTKENPTPPAIIFPGGGLFFYWQAGVVVSISKITYAHHICHALE